MHTEPYDPLWISTYNIHPSILESFLSNQTLERLFNNHAIKVGDEIYYRSSHEFTEEGATIQVEKMAKVCLFLSSPSQIFLFLVSNRF